MESPLRYIADLKVIETLRRRDGALQRGNRHLARVAQSCAELGIPFDAEKAMAKLMASGGQADTRLRMTIDRQGQIEVAAAPFSPLPKGQVWTITLADKRLKSTAPELRLKTTARALYDQTRATMPKGIDEVVFANERDEICEGTITNLFADFGHGLVTPPLRSGLLPGILREELLEQGTCKEALIACDDLPKAKRLFVGNSLRGLIPAKLA